MEKDLINIMNELNVKMYGTCSPNIDSDYIKRVESVIKKKHNCSFIKDDYLTTMNPELYLDGCRGIIVIAVAYHNNKVKLNKDETMFSSSSWGTDYHVVFKNKLNQIIDKLSLLYENDKFISLVDNHSLDERYYAYKSGIGYYGSNNLIINKDYGCNIFLGIILTTYPFIDKNVTINNEKDSLYEKVCPGKAITKDGINYNKCISYLTQKKELTKDEESKINNLVYGCDVCTTVCKLNKDKDIPNQFDFDNEVIFNLNDEFNLSNKEFKDKYGRYSGSWRGKNIIKRNLKLIKENRMKKDIKIKK